VEISGAPLLLLGQLGSPQPQLALACLLCLLLLPLLLLLLLLLLRLVAAHDTHWDVRR
jgi:hypothetical protein